MPLISVVIAFVPQSFAETLMALHEAGRLTMKVVSEDEEPIATAAGGIDYAGEHYPLFVDCIGQPHLPFEKIPFRGLHEKHIISPARLRFRDAGEGQRLAGIDDQQIRIYPDGEVYLTVSGLAINDHFQILDSYNALNNR